MKKSKTNSHWLSFHVPKTRAKVVSLVVLLICIIPTNVGAISEEQEGVIEQNCSSVRQSLKQLQRADSKVRVYLGTSYEKILTNFMTPLVTRLENNGAESSEVEVVRTNFLEISTLRSDFATARADFVSTYTDYQRSLEELVAYDCEADASGFYDKLEATRVKRASLNQITVQMRSMIGKHERLVEGVRDAYVENGDE